MIDFYREEFMEHYKNPQNKGKLLAPSLSTTVKNPMCGDILHMEVLLEDKNIKDIAFDGEACAVCIASASLLTEEMKEKPIEDVKKFSKDDLLSLLKVNLSTSRIKCAELALDAMYSLKDMYDKKS